ncbi:response regulator [Zavarzinella formosa]|uniref:response regulator n=1 Tax=Zavarzinella formosa TaxID=360055 RepID=UPI00036A2BCA|nr:response regulator transcription factor [Zavarzinella formosa]
MTTPLPLGGTPAPMPLHHGKITVLVADGHAVVREGVKALLNAQPDMRVVAEAVDGPEAVRLANEADPDVVILEVSLPGLSGPDVAAQIRAARPDQKVVVLTACEETGSVRLLLAAGVVGYVLKRATADQLLHAIRSVAGGGSYLDPVMADGLVAPSTPPDAMLSEREGQVLRMVAIGYSNKEIAARMKLSVKTIETYKTRAMEKLRMRSRVDLVRYANERGWLTDKITGENAADVR